MHIAIGIVIASYIEYAATYIHTHACVNIAHDIITFKVENLQIST